MPRELKPRLSLSCDCIMPLKAKEEQKMKDARKGTNKVGKGIK